MRDNGIDATTEHDIKPENPEVADKLAKGIEDRIAEHAGRESTPDTSEATFARTHNTQENKQVRDDLAQSITNEIEKNNKNSGSELVAAGHYGHQNIPEDKEYINQMAESLENLTVRGHSAPPIAGKAKSENIQMERDPSFSSGLSISPLSDFPETQTGNIPDREHPRERQIPLSDNARRIMNGERGELDMFRSSLQDKSTASPNTEHLMPTKPAQDVLSNSFEGKTKLGIDTRDPAPISGDRPEELKGSQIPTLTDRVDGPEDIEEIDLGDTPLPQDPHGPG